MSFFSTLFGNDNETSFSDKDIAFDMIKDSKYKVTALTTAAMDAANPELRDIFRTQLDDAVKEHFELSDLLINKGWYKAFDSPEKQLMADYDEVESLIE